jgi:hypothetical protein
MRSKAGVRDDDGIPIAGGDAAEKLLAVLRFKILLARHEDVCARIQHEQFGRKLAEHVVGHGEHGLARQSQPFQLHRGGNHGIGLARADDMAEQRVGRLQDAPDTGFLVCMQLNIRARAGQRQVFAVKCADAGMIERVIVKPHEPFAPPESSDQIHSLNRSLMRSCFSRAASVDCALTTGFLST